jgi:hypothetical protein
MAAVLLCVAYFGATRHPVPQAPAGAEAERDVTEVFNEPVGTEADLTLQGDLLIERFYFLEVETGRQRIFDFCKGHVRKVVASPGGDSVGYRYKLVLDRTRLPAEAPHLTAFIQTVVPREGLEAASYLGLRVQGGMAFEVFPLNYDGTLPDENVNFRDGEGRDVFAFLDDQVFSEITAQGFKLVNVEGNNFLLSNTDLMPWVSPARSVILAELMIVDTTSPDRASLLHEIAQRKP